MYKILKQISKDVKQTACIQGNIDENVFLQYYEKLWNTTNINELQLEHNSADYWHAFLTLDELGHWGVKAALDISNIRPLKVKEIRNG